MSGWVWVEVQGSGILTVSVRLLRGRHAGS